MTTIHILPNPGARGWDPGLAQRFAEDMAGEMPGWANDMGFEIERLRDIQPGDCAAPDIYLGYWRGATGFSLPEDFTSEIWLALRNGDLSLYEVLWEERTELRELMAARDDDEDGARLRAFEERVVERRRTRGPFPADPAYH